MADPETTDDGCCHKTRLVGAPCPIGRECPFDKVQNQTTARDWQKRLYLEAYRAANPDRDDPIVDYENGWWVFRSRRELPPERRIRTKEFAEMTFRLEERAKESANA